MHDLLGLVTFLVEVLFEVVGAIYTHAGSSSTRRSGLEILSVVPGPEPRDIVQIA